MIYEQSWKDYVLIDTSDGNRLERWGKYILIRPDPQVLWISDERYGRSKLWEKADAVYLRSNSGGGYWDIKKPLPKNWHIAYEPLSLTFEVTPMGFKHMGIFPEQAANWRFMHDTIKAAKSSSPDKEINVLNLFSYTGGATLACAKAGANVCHVDAQKNIVSMARQNAELSALGSAKIRYIVDDCVKFVSREIRRGKKYDAVVLDPPSYGRGASGEMWKIEEHLFMLLEMIKQLLTDKPLFIVINLYTAGLAPSCAGYMLSMLMSRDFGGKVESDEIGLFTESTQTPFPCGAFSRWIGLS